MTKTIKVVSLKMVREKSVKYEPVCHKVDVMNLLKQVLDKSAVEMVVIIGLDNANRPTVMQINYGAVNQCSTFPSTIFKILLLSNSVGFIMAHNHPGNTLVASECDWAITSKLKKGGECLDLTLLDHLIFNEDCSESYSLRNSHRW